MVIPYNSLDIYSIPIKPEHEILRRNIRRFVDRRIKSIWRDIEEEDTIPVDILKKIADLGIFGISIPEEYGGQGGDQISKMIVIEEVSRVAPSIGVIIDTTDFPLIAILLWGDKDQKRRYLPKIVDGSVSAAAYTEPQAGSWLSGIKTMAVRKGDKYIINGRKIFVSTLDYAKYIVVLARTSPINPEKLHAGMSLFLINMDTPGVKLGQKLNVMGMKGDRPYELMFDNVVVPADNLIGVEGLGYYYTMTLLNFTRINIAAQAVGIAQGAFEKALDYSLDREAFNKKIYQFESTAFKVSDMFVRIQASRLLTYWAANLSELQFKFPNKTLLEIALAGSAAKIYATETAEFCARQAIQIHGGYGVDVETGVERYLRDSVITTIYEGTNEIQRYIIARFIPRLTRDLKLSIG